jgi:hypothetical protein
MYESGIILGSLVITYAGFMSFTAAMATIESLAIQNAFLKEEKLVLEAAAESHINDTIAENPPINEKTKTKVIDYDEKDDNFYIFKRFELSTLAKQIFPKPIYYTVVGVVICYLYVVITSASIIAANSLRFIVGKMIGYKFPEYWYEIFLGGFYFVVIIISLNNINKLRKFSLLIMCFRLTVILSMFGVCIYCIIINGPADISKVPKFEVENIALMMGNGIFFFMCHHSLPGIVENFYPQKNLKKYIIISYIASLLLLQAIGYTAILAFADMTTCDTEVFPSAIEVIYLIT